MTRSYEINPRPAELGAGWRLRLLEDGEEVGGGVFPAEEGFDTPEEANQFAFNDAFASGNRVDGK